MYGFVFFGDSGLSNFKSSHSEFQCRLDLADHTHAVHLVKAQSWTRLFLKSKSCGCVAARQAGLFSLSLVCFFFSSLSLSLSLFVSLSDFSPPLVFRNLHIYWPGMQG